MEQLKIRLLQTTNEKNNEIERLTRDTQDALRQAEDEKDDAIYELKRVKDQELEMVNYVIRSLVEIDLTTWAFERLYFNQIMQTMLSIRDLHT